MRLFQRGATWYVTHGRGAKRIKLSTGESDYERALAVAQRLVAPALMEREADRIEVAARMAGRLRRDAAALRGAEVSWEAAWDAMGRTESRHGGPRAERTMADYHARWAHFAAAMWALGHQRPADVAEADAAAWVAGHAPRARQIAWNLLGMVYRAIGLDAPRGRKPRRPASAEAHREPLTAAQVAALIARADADRRISPEYGTLLRLLAYTGLRLGDAASLRVGQVDLVEGIISRRASKTGAELRLPLHPALAAELARVIAADAAPGDYVLPSLAGYGPGALSHRITRLMVAAGIPRLPGRHCAHCLRTTFAALCAEGGVPIGVIQGWLGHASQEVTRIYARVEDMRARRAALSRLPDFGGQ